MTDNELQQELSLAQERISPDSLIAQQGERATMHNVKRGDILVRVSSLLNYKRVGFAIVIDVTTDIVTLYEGFPTYLTLTEQDLKLSGYHLLAHPLTFYAAMREGTNI